MTCEHSKTKFSTTDNISISVNAQQIIYYKQRTKKNKETGNSRYIYQNKYDLAFNDDFSDLHRGKASDEVLYDKGI